jgi:hypothetical protein
VSHTQPTSETSARAPVVLQNGGSWRVEFPTESGRVQSYLCAAQSDASRFAHALRSALGRKPEHALQLAKRSESMRGPTRDGAPGPGQASLLLLSILLALLFGQQAAAPVVAGKRKKKARTGRNRGPAHGRSNHKRRAEPIRIARVVPEAFADRESVRLSARAKHH